MSKIKKVSVVTFYNYKRSGKILIKMFENSEDVWKYCLRAEGKCDRFISELNVPLEEALTMVAANENN